MGPLHEQSVELNRRNDALLLNGEFALWVTL
jgi:hypothetical protein